MDEQWTIAELVDEAAIRIAALPAPRNGQVRAVPDDRTIRYYAALGLLARPLAMRGRTALYGRRHLAQVVAIKRLQATGRSLAEIQALWSTMDDVSLSRMSGVAFATVAPLPTERHEFWKREPIDLATPAPPPVVHPGPIVVPLPPALMPMPVDDSVELRIQLSPGIYLSLAVPDGISNRLASSPHNSLQPTDVHALRVAAAPLVELARSRLGAQPGGGIE